jgi:chromate transporter
MVPLTVGLVLAGGYVITRAADHTWTAYGISAATVLLVTTTRLNPLWIFGSAALLGLAGLV